MARKEMILRVLVASPDDVQAERDRLEDLIRRRNKIWSLNFGKRLELLRWETDISPGVGADTQAVINEQIGDNYDIFIGIMWTKVGTRTPRAVSGTVEEFDRAYKRFQNDPEALKIMLYFCKADIPQSNFDSDQYAKLIAFKESLKEGKKGVLYFTYDDVSEFEELLFLHLNKQLFNYGKDWGKPTPSQVVQVKPQEETAAAFHEAALVEEETEDEGLLDVVERGSEDFETMSGSLQGMTRAVYTLGTCLEKRKNEMTNASSKSKKPELFVKRAHQITNRTASNLDAFVARIRYELPIFSESLSGAVSAVAKAASLFGEFRSQDRQPIASLLKMVTELGTSIKGALGATNNFRSILKAWPRVATKLNRAKARALTTLNELISELDKGARLISAVEEELRRILSQEE